MPDLPRVRNQGRTTAGEEAGGGPRGSWHLFIGKPHDFDMRTRLVVLGVPFLFEKQPFIFETPPWRFSSWYFTPPALEFYLRAVVDLR